MVSLYLFTYEIAYLIRQAEQWNRDSAIPRHILTILLAKRFIDDIFFPRLKRVNLEDMLYDNREAGGSDGIYPPSLAGPTGIIDNPLELTTASEGRTVHYLDYNVKLSDRGFISTKVYDKRDDNLVLPKIVHSRIVCPLYPISAKPVSCFRNFTDTNAGLLACVLFWIDRSFYFGKWWKTITPQPTYIGKFGRSQLSPPLRVAGR